MLHRPEPDAPTEDSVYLSQRDVRELQFAKAAIATGWTLLLEELGLEHARRPAGAAGRLVRQLPVARAAPSGSGWCPKLPVLRIVSAGNVAGEGAKMALLSMRERAGAQALLEEVTLCRALRPHRLQRPVRRPARLPRLTVARDRVDRPTGSPLVACGALAQPCAEVVARARLAGRRAPAAAAAAQPARS